MAIPATADRALLESDVTAFDRDGFVVIDRPVFSDDALAKVQRVFAGLEMIDRNAHLHNLGTDDTYRIDEIVWATRLAPMLKRSAVFTQARRLAAHLMGSDVIFHFDHVIDKPAGTRGVTQWHQDQAFEPDGGEKVTIWVPLVSVDERNGCLRFIPGSHRLPLLDHYAVGEGLATDAVDERAAIAGPIRRGGFSAHRELTLHSAGPNDTSERRPAWVLRFGRYDGIRARRVVSEVIRGTSSAPGLSRFKGRKLEQLRPQY